MHRDAFDDVCGVNRLRGAWLPELFSAMLGTVWNKIPSCRNKQYRSGSPILRACTSAALGTVWNSLEQSVRNAVPIVSELLLASVTEMITKERKHSNRNTFSYASCSLSAFNVGLLRCLKRTRQSHVLPKSCGAHRLQ